MEHRINYGRLYPGKTYKADCTCGWSCEGTREHTRAAIHAHENETDQQQIYDLLKRAGHSAAKALEISIDYERGDKIAKQWVAVARSRNE